MIEVFLSPRFIITKHPVFGMAYFERHCDIERFKRSMKALNYPPVQYAFQTEGGGFSLEGNPRADAAIGYSL